MQENIPVFDSLPYAMRDKIEIALRRVLGPKGSDRSNVVEALSNRSQLESWLSTTPSPFYFIEFQALTYYLDCLPLESTEPEE